MKQLKFLKMITLDGKPIWHEGCLYDIVDENGTMYKLFSEDLQLRGIDKKLEDIFYKVVEIQKPKQIETKETKIETKKNIKNNVSESKVATKIKPKKQAKKA